MQTRPAADLILGYSEQQGAFLLRLCPWEHDAGLILSVRVQSPDYSGTPKVMNYPAPIIAAAGGIGLKVGNSAGGGEDLAARMGLPYGLLWPGLGLPAAATGKDSAEHLPGGSTGVPRAAPAPAPAAASSAVPGAGYRPASFAITSPQLSTPGTASGFAPQRDSSRGSSTGTDPRGTDTEVSFGAGADAGAVAGDGSDVACRMRWRDLWARATHRIRDALFQWPDLNRRDWHAPAIVHFRVVLDVASDGTLRIRLPALEAARGETAGPSAASAHPGGSVRSTAPEHYPGSPAILERLSRQADELLDQLLLEKGTLSFDPKFEMPLPVQGTHRRALTRCRDTQEDKVLARGHVETLCRREKARSGTAGTGYHGYYMLRRSMSDYEHSRIVLVYCSRSVDKTIMTLVHSKQKDPSQLRLMPTPKDGSTEEKHGDLDGVRQRFRDAASQAAAIEESPGPLSGMMEVPANRWKGSSSDVNQFTNPLLQAWEAVERWEHACQCVRSCLDFGLLVQDTRGLDMPPSEPLVHPVDREKLQGGDLTAAEWVQGFGPTDGPGGWLTSGLQTTWPKGAGTLDEHRPEYTRLGLGQALSGGAGSGGAGAATGGASRGAVAPVGVCGGFEEDVRYVYQLLEGMQRACKSLAGSVQMCRETDAVSDVMQNAFSSRMPDCVSLTLTRELTGADLAAANEGARSVSQSEAIAVPMPGSGAGAGGMEGSQALETPRHRPARATASVPEVQAVPLPGGQYGAAAGEQHHRAGHNGVTAGPGDDAQRFSGAVQRQASNEPGGGYDDTIDDRPRTIGASYQQPHQHTPNPDRNQGRSPGIAIGTDRSGRSRRSRGSTSYTGPESDGSGDEADSSGRSARADSRHTHQHSASSGAGDQSEAGQRGIDGEEPSALPSSDFLGVGDLHHVLWDYVTKVQVTRSIASRSKGEKQLLEKQLPGLGRYVRRQMEGLRACCYAFDMLGVGYVKIRSIDLAQWASHRAAMQQAIESGRAPEAATLPAVGLLSRSTEARALIRELEHRADRLMCGGSRQLSDEHLTSAVLLLAAKDLAEQRAAQLEELERASGTFGGYHAEEGEDEGLDGLDLDDWGGEKQAAGMGPSSDQPVAMTRPQPGQRVASVGSNGSGTVSQDRSYSLVGLVPTAQLPSDGSGQPPVARREDSDVNMATNYDDVGAEDALQGAGGVAAAVPQSGAGPGWSTSPMPQMQSFEGGSYGAAEGSQGAAQETMQGRGRGHRHGQMYLYPQEQEQGQGQGQGQLRPYPGHATEFDAPTPGPLAVPGVGGGSGSKYRQGSGQPSRGVEGEGQVRQAPYPASMHLGGGMGSFPPYLGQAEARRESSGMSQDSQFDQMMPTGGGISGMGPLPAESSGLRNPSLQYQTPGSLD